MSIRSYAAVHKLLVRRFGSAKLRTCECGAPAQAWSYNGNSPHEVTGVTVTRNRRGESYPTNVTYSPEPEDYTARCRSCHVALDWTPERRQAQSILTTLRPVRPARVTIGKVTVLRLLGLDARQTADALDCSMPRVYEVIRDAKEHTR